ncbi:MAG: hypothetical protein AAGF92_14885 [Myxococcota bacterium]
MRHVALSVFLAPFFATLFAQTATADVIVRPQSTTSSSVVVKTRPPTVVVVQKKTAVPPRPPPTKPRLDDRERKVGLHFDVAGAFGGDLAMGGFTGALRLRPAKHFALDLGSGYLAGRDSTGAYRSEVPVTANMLFFVNPQHKVQFYFLLGGGASFGRREELGEVRDMIHAGGQLGAGLEFRIARGFALNLDVRGVVRQRVDNDPRPEFIDGTRGTDTSAGAVTTFGATVYF